MCDECEFGGCCALQDEICRRVLLAGETRDLTSKVLKLAKDCVCFLRRREWRVA